jgi:hypothetical protein
MSMRCVAMILVGCARAHDGVPIPVAPGFAERMAIMVRYSRTQSGKEARTLLAAPEEQEPEESAIAEGEQAEDAGDAEPLPTTQAVDDAGPE